MTTVTFTWMTTAPHPFRPAHTHGADQGQVGWKLHAVPATGGETYAEIKRRPALCGLRAKHGWATDLFINAPCSRCEAAMGKATGTTFEEVGT